MSFSNKLIFSESLSTEDQKILDWLLSNCEEELRNKDLKKLVEKIIEQHKKNKWNGFKLNGFFGQAYLLLQKTLNINILKVIDEVPLYAFLKSSLTSITIPDNVRIIGIHAFDRCTSLTNIIIGDGVTSIGKYTFADCTSLKSIKWKNKEYKTVDEFMTDFKSKNENFKYKTIEEALLKEYINRDENTSDEITSIENPFKGGDKAKGFNDALQVLANALFGKNQGKSLKSNQEQDPRLIQPPQNKNQKSDPENSENDNKQNNQNQQNQKQDIDSLSKEELDKLIDKVKAARDKAKDVIDDNDSQETDDENNSSVSEKSDNEIKEIEKELSDLEKEAKNAETQSDANKINARLKAIADFWNEDSTNSYKTDVQAINNYKRLNKKLRDQAIQARANATKRNHNYRPMNIDAIINKIVKTIKTQVSDIRDSSWNRYNDRANSLGYVAPGRFTNKAPNKKPAVVFYFDVSGSWCGNIEKIDMGHRIEEALKKLEAEKKIELSCYYFGTEVHSTFTTDDQGNSDAPIPHAIELLNAKQLDNVIIMTDDNPESNQKLQVPGYAWLLFYDTVSESLATNVSGKKGTSIVMIDHKKENK